MLNHEYLYVEEILQTVRLAKAQRRAALAEQLRLQPLTPKLHQRRLSPAKRLLGRMSPRAWYQPARASGAPLGPADS